MIFESLTFFFTFVTTLILLRFYIKISETINISDKPTNYNMHDRNVITGSGITLLLFIFCHYLFCYF